MALALIMTTLPMPIHLRTSFPTYQKIIHGSLYRQRNIILCVGQGRGEEELLESTRCMDEILNNKGIPAWVDYWGYDVDHDWPWWRKQLAYFMQKIVS